MKKPYPPTTNSNIWFFNMKRWKGQAGSIRFIGRLVKVTELIDNASDGIDKVNAKEEVWLGWFVGEGVAQIIRGMCTTNEDHL